jgi:hypothetical protein
MHHVGRRWCGGDLVAEFERRSMDRVIGQHRVTTARIASVSAARALAGSWPSFSRSVPLTAQTGAIRVASLTNGAYRQFQSRHTS